MNVSGGATCGNDTQFGAEDELDIEDVAGLVPGAQIKVYEGPSSGNGAYNTHAAIVQDRSSQVVSTSWGLCETAQHEWGGGREHAL